MPTGCLLYPTRTRFGRRPDGSENRVQCTDPEFWIGSGLGIGALDGTYIKVKVNESDKPRYRTRKGDIAVNVLVACDMDKKLTYLLSGWEGSAADSRVLRDALNRPNGLKVPQGTYYFCDNGYANEDGFLTPFKGIRYHLKDWGERSLTPQHHHEYFNMYHSKARNVIERTIGLLKTRWAVLQSQTFYSITTQNRIIMACALLHNFIRSEMLVDPLDHCLDDTNSDDEDNDIDLIETIESSQAWTNFRDNLASSMFNEWRDVR
ncbi:hypothetical protein BUALT_Bualt05G0133800 [Buddleja alternifolia]|uniref:DDE Tnp4 domain-containing protein n=1 Tax=Buddleja alternifolia TaxID=168488 RepID=A0AAV6XN92_9LAMI|nr:hypothetical protein BUALT_Bualt05G0133800 [Buddleja alternifolia]